MRTALALALAAAVPAFAQENAEPASASRPAVDVMAAIAGVWAYDRMEMEEPGDYTCGERPLAMQMIDGGARVAAMRSGEAPRYALVLDVRNDFPIGPAMSMVWSDAPLDEDGDPLASVLIMDGPDGFSWIEGPALSAFQSGAPTLNRGPRRVRCELAPVEAAEEAPADDDAAE